MKRLATLLLVSAIATSCNQTKQISTKMNAAFDYEAHRGGRGLYPENTIPAFLHALDLKVSTLEMDCVISADGQVVLSHEPFFSSDISSHPDGSPVKSDEAKKLNIYKMNYDEIAKFDVGKRVHPKFPEQIKMSAVKPLLTDVIKAVKEKCISKNIPLPYFNIETKSKPSTDNVYHPAPEKFVDLIMNVITQHGMEDKIIIQSFDFRTLQYLHKKYPLIKTAMLIEANDSRSLRKQLDDLGFVPTIYSPEKSLTTPNSITEAHERGMKVIPWTVNDKKQIKNLMKMGVDGIISDYPNYF